MVFKNRRISWLLSVLTLLAWRLGQLQCWMCSTWLALLTRSAQSGLYPPVANPVVPTRKAKSGKRFLEMKDEQTLRIPHCQCTHKHLLFLFNLHLGVGDRFGLSKLQILKGGHLVFKVHSATTKCRRALQAFSPVLRAIKNNSPPNPQGHRPSVGFFLCEVAGAREHFGRSCCMVSTDRPVMVEVPVLGMAFFAITLQVLQVGKTFLSWLICLCKILSLWMMSGIQATYHPWTKSAKL